MPLATYRNAAFDQGALLTARFPLKKNAHEGVCYSLVIEFYRKLRTGSATAAALATHLEGALGTCINRQAMHDDGLAELKRKGGGSYDFVQLFNSMGRVSGVQWRFNGSAGATSAEFTTRVAAETATAFMLRIEFIGGGGHAIAFIKTGTGIVLFDPNFGIHSGATSAIATALWAEYSGMNMVINKWWIIEQLATGGVGLGSVSAAT